VKTFNCVISQIYQCTEGFLAISDKHSNRLTMNEEFIIIEKEWLDEKRFVPIITDLARTTQPIIRYRLDDVLVFSEQSEIFTELDEIEGRLGDVCYAKHGVSIVPVFADSLRQHMATSAVSFEDYKITQLSLNEFSIQITPDIIDKNKMLEHLNQFFHKKQCDIPKWQWQSYQENLLDKKFRRIQSYFKP